MFGACAYRRDRHNFGCPEDRNWAASMHLSTIDPIFMAALRPILVMALGDQLNCLWPLSLRRRFGGYG